MTNNMEAALDTLGKDMEMASTALQVQDEAQGHQEIPRIVTPLGEAMAARRHQPTSQIADMVTREREEMENWRRQREACEAFQSTKIEKERGEYASREDHRLKTIEELRRQVTELIRIGEADAADMRARVAAMEADIKQQMTALDKLIRAGENKVQELTRR